MLILDARQGDFYMPNDVLVNGIRVSNLFSTRDEQFHNTAVKPVRGLYSMTTSTSLEPHVDRMLELFTHTLDERFENGKKAVDMADYLPFCEYQLHGMIVQLIGQSHGIP